MVATHPTRLQGAQVKVQKLKVESHTRDYEVLISSSLETLQSFYKSERKTFLVVDKALTDDMIFMKPLLGSAFKTKRVQAGEALKTLKGAEVICEWLARNNFNKGDVLVGVGGGTVQDLVGFVAQLFHRGCEWHYVPSTLLAQADSCVGSKTSINLNNRKNTLGGFYPPSLVLIATDFLRSLSDFDLASGNGEIFKFGLLKDISWSREGAKRNLVTRDNQEDWVRVIQECLSWKSQVVQADEFDRNQRRILNYGHSFGHALELSLDRNIQHGLAVVWGIDVANWVGMRRGFTSQSVFENVRMVISETFPLLPSARLDSRLFWDSLKRDKKATRAGIGEIFLADFGAPKEHFICFDSQLVEDVTHYFKLPPCIVPIT